NTNMPNQSNGSAHCDEKRPALYASASTNTPIALVRLSAGNHPHDFDSDPVTAELLLDASGNLGTSSLVSFVSITSCVLSTSAPPPPLEPLFNPSMPNIC